MRRRHLLQGLGLAATAAMVTAPGTAQPMQPTALVHEAYLRLVGQNQQNWDSRSHFFGVAAHLMRLILVDWARRGRSLRSARR